MRGAPPTDPETSPGVEEPQAEPRAHEVLGEGAPRRVAGQGLAERVGARRWERAPVVCCSERIFKRCELADPWDPDSSDRPIAVGPVGMRFEERRQPAPHARIKEQKKPSQGPAWTPPSGIPQAAAKPSPAKPAAARRPPGAAAGGDADPTAGRSLPPVKPPPATAKTRTGRFRMRSTSSTGPRVRPLPVVSAPPPSEPEPPPAPEAPRSAPQAQGLDDLFGGPGGGRDRRVGRKKK